MPSVFITQESKGRNGQSLNYSPALHWGDRLVGIFEAGDQVGLFPQRALGHARSVLKQLKPEDFLVLSGDPVIIGICIAVAAELVGKVRLLRWNPQDFTYTPIEVDFVDRVPVA